MAQPSAQLLPRGLSLGRQAHPFAAAPSRGISRTSAFELGHCTSPSAFSRIAVHRSDPRSPLVLTQRPSPQRGLPVPLARRAAATGPEPEAPAVAEVGGSEAAEGDISGATAKGMPRNSNGSPVSPAPSPAAPLSNGNAAATSTPDLTTEAEAASAVAVSASASAELVSAPAPLPVPAVSGVGSPSPLGPSPVRDANGKATAVNFALFSQHGTAVTLCLYTKGQRSGAPDVQIPLDPSKGHRTGDVWHIQVSGIAMIGTNYVYRVDGPRDWATGNRFDPSLLLVDPYAPLLDGRRVWGDSREKMAPFVGTFDFASPPFDWGDDGRRERIREEDVVVYEMNVRAFTADPSSGLDPDVRGSYRGVAEKVHHLVELGVNTVELLPIHEFDEFEFQRQVNPRNHMLNTWGYSTINFFAPIARYGSGGKGPVEASRELKSMIKTLHQAGIEVILDVVYNHTNEGDDEFPYTTSFKGIDCSVYYILDLSQYVQLTNYSGCGNTFNCNHPVVMQLILDSLRHWVTEYHVDGFRFDLASILCRGTKGEPLQAPPLIRACAKDEVLSKVRLIAEPWDCGGLYLVGRCPNWDKWAEWNGKYRDDVRRFIKGDMGMKGAFATRLAGSADLYNVNNRKPWASVNFVIAHDGFSLYDQVAYNQKHNEANGEGGKDGSNDNFSWNCGVEGPTNDEDVNALRSRQMRNFHLALMLSQGVPMMLMGDEYAHTRYGNNNSYGHDTSLNHFLWNKLEEQRSSLFRFFSGVNTLRRAHPSLGQPNFLSPSDIRWHEDNWGNPDSRFLAFTLADKSGRNQDLYATFNAHVYFVENTLPQPPNGKTWCRLVDTNLPSPRDIEFVESTEQGLKPLKEVPIAGKYNIAPFSSIVLLAL